MASDAQVLEIPGRDGVRELRLTSPDRLMWPTEGITKAELAAYILAVGSP